MTDPTRGRRLSVDADLELSIDGVEATLAGHGDDLTLRTDEPARLARALRRSGVLRTLRQLDERVAAPGLELPALTVHGPRGRIARVAPDARRVRLRASPAGSTLRWYRPQDVVPPAAKWAVLGTLVVALFLVAARWRR